MRLNEAKAILDEVVTPAKTAGNVFNGVISSPLSGVAGYMKRKEKEKEIIEKLKKKKNANVDDVEKMRDKADKDVRSTERKWSAGVGAIGGGIAGVMGGPLAPITVPAGAMAGAAALSGLTTAGQGLRYATRKTLGRPFKNRSNRKFLAAAKKAKEAKEDDKD